MPLYPGQSGSATQLTVDQMLKYPRLVSRDLVNLGPKRFVADQLLVRGTPDMVAGGAMRYQRDESIYVSNDPEQSTPRARWPRTGWTEEARTEAIKEYGLEVVINNLAIRHNIRPQLTIGLRKLANNLVRFIDGAVFDMLEADADVQTFASAAVWTNVATDIIKEIAKAQEQIETQDNGYSGFSGAVLVLHTKRRDDLLNNTALRDALPRELQNGQIQTGVAAPFLGLSGIVFSSQITETVAFVMDTTVAGVIADSEPDPAEGFQAYTPPGAGNFAPIWTKVYNEEPKDKVVAGARWPAMALIAPKAVVKVTAVA